MIVELMMYTTLISLLVGLAAVALERVFALARWPRRGLWITSMALSLIVSGAMSLGTHASPKSVRGSPVTAVTRASSPVLVPPPISMPFHPTYRAATAFPGRQRVETVAGWAWAASSILLLGTYLIGALRLNLSRHRWPRQIIGGHTVHVTESVGPAVFGVVRPVMVVPAWLLDQPSARREAALLHEEQHILAHDPALLLGALLLLALTAWNLPLWCQLRRLRLAIEVDCDARVLGTGMERGYYLDTLLCINQRAGTVLLGAMAIVGRISQLERRARAMTLKTPRHPRLWMVGWAVAAIPILVVAAQVNPPTSAPAAAAAPHAHLGVGVADFDVNGPATSLTHHQHRGALITYVGPGDVADKAGIERGDVVVQFGDTAIEGANALVAAVGQTPVGARIPLIVHRGTADLNLFADFSMALPPQPAYGGQPVYTGDWDSLRDANMSPSQPQLRDELIRMARLDAMVQPANLQKLLSQRPDTGVITAGPKIDPAEAAGNIRRLKQIIAQYGWPTVSMVGVRGAVAAGLIAGGARDDAAFQAQVLALMEPLLQRDEVPAMYYASMFDTVHTPQRFGMSSVCRNGKYVPSKPIEDPDHLEQRRAALGLVKLPSSCVSLVDTKSGD